MNVKQILIAGLLGIATSTSLTALQVNAQNLQVSSGSTSRNLDVAINRAIVVESDTPFAELSVANPQVADIVTLSDRTLYVLGKAPGRTTLTLLGEDGRLISNVEVRVSPDIGEIKERLREIMPNEPIEIRTANDGLVLSGVVSSAGVVDRALELARRYSPDAVSNLMSVGGTQQVMLKVRFAEMNRSVSKDLSASLGFDTGTEYVQAIGLTQTLLDSTNGSSSLGNQANPIGSITSTREANGVFALGFGTSSLRAAIVLEALETKGLVRTLAEPNLSALSGQEATFLAGGEYPIPTSTEDGIVVEFHPFGVELRFTPTVVDQDIINLRLATAVSSIDTSVVVETNGISVNAFSKRSSTTTIELRDGESFAIAGLLLDDFTDSSSQVPFLGDIPVLGALFRSANFARNQSELVIIVSAHLVSPTRGNSFVLPTDRIRPPSERELFLNGRIASTRSGGGSSLSDQDFSGSYGYVLE
ncbi:MAG: type II and III secretion system protein family protein [Litoreibacter sp.]